MPILMNPFAKKKKKKPAPKPGSKSFVGPVKPKAKVRRKSRLRTAIEKGVSRRRLKRLAKKGKVDRAGAKKKGTVKASAYAKKTQKSQEKIMPGVTKTGIVSRGAVGAVKTKGGTYAKYAKGSKESKSFNAAFSSGCKGDAKSFSWQGRSYACKKA